MVLHNAYDLYPGNELTTISEVKVHAIKAVKPVDEDMYNIHVGIICNPQAHKTLLLYEHSHARHTHITHIHIRTHARTHTHTDTHTSALVCSISVRMFSLLYSHWSCSGGQWV